ncbi:hypothetical protein LPB86_10900 [Pedobacter sp. MC2016-14]|uniref:hypothetical protein n=1 Tax=Pedobacter sp. MC2016-14 TaxID=2897327 RepID=UPI001E59B648|nr:hypothetical protein [Pedobacter sp. MC2016-14]MCD0488743.1 hypothetical protein [Pedobacter sp. MC2016-14]
MISKFIRLLFFGNYFIGLLAVALTIESTLQLKVPFNSLAYYALIFCSPIAYYTYAYMGATKFNSSLNPRAAWYFKHKNFIKWSQALFSSLSLLLFLYLFIHNFYSILHLPLVYWAIVLIILIAAVLYYGLLPSYFFNLNLRNTGWLKPFIIGFIWACTANILPLILLKIESGADVAGSALWVWLFVKNWMFCTVNAIMFDIKDYAIDANKELKTFVVRVGIRKTIFSILLPLLIIGILSLFTFAYIQQFASIQVICNVIPFILTMIVAFSLHTRKKILYYLIVIDGLILVKAICGILGIILATRL